MPVDRMVSLAIIQRELAQAQRLGQHHGWVFSPLDDARLSFTVKLTSLVDGEEYNIEFVMDDYKELPAYIEFFDPKMGERGTKRCYPRDQRNGNEGSIFHEAPCICHQSSRKAYAKYGGPHSDWMPQISNWVAHAGGLTTIGDILQMIQARINDKSTYKGRMQK